MANKRDVYAINPRECDNGPTPVPAVGHDGASFCHQMFPVRWVRSAITVWAWAKIVLGRKPPVIITVRKSGNLNIVHDGRYVRYQLGDLAEVAADKDYPVKVVRADAKET